MERQTFTIDAKGKPLGRLASQVAILLRGKNKSDFVRYKDMGDNVLIQNVDKIKFTGNKFTQKTYYSHSGYLGGMKEIKMDKLFQKDSKRILKIAVYGMLPINKLRSIQIRRLKFE